MTVMHSVVQEIAHRCHLSYRTTALRHHIPNKSKNSSLLQRHAAFKGANADENNSTQEIREALSSLGSSILFSLSSPQVNIVIYWFPCLSHRQPIGLLLRNHIASFHKAEHGLNIGI